MAFKTFATEAEYNAEIAAAEQRGVASTIDPAVVAQQKAVKVADAINEYAAKAKADGRPLSALQALQEMTSRGLIDPACA